MRPIASCYNRTGVVCVCVGHTDKLCRNGKPIKIQDVILGDRFAWIPETIY